MKRTWLTTNGQNVYFCQGNQVQGIYDGSTVHQAALSSNRERSVEAVYGSDTVYFDRERGQCDCRHHAGHAHERRLFESQTAVGYLWLYGPAQGD